MLITLASPVSNYPNRGIHNFFAFCSNVEFKQTLKAIMIPLSTPPPSSAFYSLSSESTPHQVMETLLQNLRDGKSYQDLRQCILNNLQILGKRSFASVVSNFVSRDVTTATKEAVALLAMKYW